MSGGSLRDDDDEPWFLFFFSKKVDTGSALRALEKMRTNEVAFSSVRLSRPGTYCTCTRSSEDFESSNLSAQLACRLPVAVASLHCRDLSSRAYRHLKKNNKTQTTRVSGHRRLICPT
jgi:hypothetical protein